MQNERCLSRRWSRTRVNSRESDQRDRMWKLALAKRVCNIESPFILSFFFFFFDSQTMPGGYCDQCDSNAIFWISSLVRFGLSEYWGSATADCLCSGSTSDARQGHPSEFVSERVNIRIGIKLFMPRARFLIVIKVSECSGARLFSPNRGRRRLPFTVKCLPSSSTTGLKIAAAWS